MDNRKRFFIPAFFCVYADTEDQADDLAVNMQEMVNREFDLDSNRVCLFLDEVIPTVEIPYENEFYSILDIVHITPMTKEEIEDIHQS